MSSRYYEWQKGLSMISGIMKRKFFTLDKHSFKVEIKYINKYIREKGYNKNNRGYSLSDRILKISEDYLAFKLWLNTQPLNTPEPIQEIRVFSHEHTKEYIESL